MNLLIFGSTGLVGSSLLEQLKLEHNVTIAVRDKSKLSLKNVEVRQINFEEFDSFKTLQYDGVYCCLGTTIKTAGSKENFKKVDLDYVELCFKYSIACESNFFCVVSALGANSESKVFYNKVKGMMEDRLIGDQKSIIVRPSLLLGHRKEHRPLEKFSTTLLGPFTRPLQLLLKKYAPIEAYEVAKSMIELSMSGETQSHIEYIIKQPGRSLA